MNKEQNINNILELLKTSCEEDQGEEIAPDVMQKSEDLSCDELQQQLRAHFMGGESKENSSDTDSDSYSYVLDDDFLTESVSDLDQETEEEIEDEVTCEEQEMTEEVVEEVVEEDDGLPPFDLADILEVTPEEEALDDADDVMADELFDDDDGADDTEDGVFIENGDGEIILIKPQTEEEPYAAESSDDVLSILGDFEPGEEEESIFDDIISDTAEESANTVEAEAEETVEEIVEETSEEIVEVPELFSDDGGQLSLFEKEESEEEMEFSLDLTEEELDTEDQISVDFGDDTDEDYSSDAPTEDTAQISDSVLDLMFEFGDVSVASGAFERARVEDYKRRKRKEDTDVIDSKEAFAFDGEEYENLEQTEKLYERYTHEKYFTLLRVLGCGFFALIMLAYEIAGGLGLIFGNMKYFPVYMLIDVQLVVLCALFAWREVLSGIKKAFTFSARRWSPVALILIFTVIYDIALIAIGVDEMPTTFGTVCCLYLLFGLLTEYLAVCREAKSFEIYASDKKKFTFDTAPGAGSSAEKMYRGGLSYDKKVFEMRDVGFPKGYFSAVNRRESTDTIVNYSITLVVLLSTLALLGCVMMRTPFDIALGAFMVALTLLSPISSFATHTFPICRATSKLYSRECAIAGEVMANKYADCEYIVFSDMHLFKKADIHKNGIVIYDEKNSRLIIEYLETLYEAIGGPMRGVFGGISSTAHQIKLRRIARNGVEAAIDGRHSIILGESDFLKRYGISFDSSQKTNDADGILGFAVDGKLSAKLCLRYEVEPFFEVIAERMEQNGMKCAIETYDPIISGAFVAACRKNRSVPINVIHKNALDYYAPPRGEMREDTGLVVCSSRFKLVESAIWCKRLRAVLKMCGAVQIVVSAVFCGALAAAVCLGYMGHIDQYIVILAQALSIIPVLMSMTSFPRDDYFSLEENKNKKKKQRKDK